MNRRDFSRWSTVFAALSCCLPALAQDYPGRPIRWIVPYLAGTAPDNTVRVVAEAMSQVLKQPVVVDNKPGAAGNIGAQMAARAAPDGYTWVYSASPMAASMRMYLKPGFDVMKDFTHVGRIAISDLAVVAPPEAGFKNLGELLERLRKEPGKLSYGSGGVGSPAHMSAELIMSTAGVTALHVPYKGASESATAVMGKQVDFALVIASVAVPHVSNNRMAALAVTGPARNPRMPQVPTLGESGLGNLRITSFGGLSVPAGTPAPVVQKIAQTLQAVLAQPDVRQKLEASGGLVAPAGTEEYTEALQAEIGLTERMMKAARLQAQ